MIAWYPSPDSTSAGNWDDTPSTISSTNNAACNRGQTSYQVDTREDRPSRWADIEEHNEWVAALTPRHQLFIEQPWVPQRAVKVQGLRQRGPERRADRRRPWW